MARKYSKVGGYPLFYYDRTGAVMCAVCADNPADRDWRDSARAEIPLLDALGVAPNWEDPQLYCDSCSTRIESAYAD